MFIPNKNNRYQVMTPDGFSDFDGIQITNKYNYLKIELSNGKIICCSYDHKFFLNSNPILAKDIIVGNKLDTSQEIKLCVVDIKEINERIKLYELIDVKKNNVYYTDELLSHNCEFLGSAGTLISGYSLKTLVHFDPIELKQNEKFLIYEYPKEDHKYVAICDVSEGLGLDASTVQIIDVTNIPYKQVAKYENNEIKTYEYPDTIYIIAKYYNEALVIVEANSIGDGVLNDLNYDLDCENLFFDNDKFGIKMTKTSKRVGNSFLKQYIEDGTLQINDFDTISQMSKYIKKGTSYQAEEDEHDDLITPLVLFSFFMRNKVWVEDWLDQDASERQENIDRLEEELLPIGFINDGDEILNMGEDNDGFISY